MQHAHVVLVQLVGMCDEQVDLALTGRTPIPRRGGSVAEARTELFESCIVTQERAHAMHHVVSQRCGHSLEGDLPSPALGGRDRHLPYDGLRQIDSVELSAGAPV